MGQGSDILVIGGGLAGLCAAIAARRAGASVRLVEAADKSLRGGNTRHSRNFRLVHDAPSAFSPGSYSVPEFLSDLRRGTQGQMDEALSALMAERSAELIDWLSAQGVKFQNRDDGMLPPSRRTAFFLGGGKALINSLYATAERLGVEIAYGQRSKVRVKDGRVVGQRAVIACSGGFQANLDWLRQSWGDAADGFHVRGSPHVTGDLLQSLLDQGAAPVGDASTCHMVAVDARGPQFDGGIVTRLDSLPYGIVVDRDGQRFADEWTDKSPSRYARWGQMIAKLPGQIAYSIFDSAAAELFMPSIFSAIEAGSLAELAGKLGLDPAMVQASADEYAGDHPLTQPPFFAYPLRPGVTFTYLGLRVDRTARVLMTNGRPAENLFAAGMIMSPNILGAGYLSGVSITIGAVFGRIAGEEAAALAA